MSEYGTLSPEGARRLRAVRDYIVAHPDEFAIQRWDCGTTACIGGHLVRMFHPTKVRFDRSHSGHISKQLGFADGAEHWEHPLYALFFSTKAMKVDRDVQKAADHINRFLWQYGYPPNEVAAPDATSAELATRHSQRRVDRGDLRQLKRSFL